MNTVNIQDIAIIDSLPIYQCDKTVLNVGCGQGRIDRMLSSMGYRVYATDYRLHDFWVNTELLTFHKSNIFKKESFPVISSPIVICSQVLEHLIAYREALANLLFLTQIRLIITVPVRRSFNNTAPTPLGHCNYWDDSLSNSFMDINEFKKLCFPYTVSITKIRTKPRDVQLKQWGYLIVVNKRQKYC